MVERDHPEPEDHAHEPRAPAEGHSQGRRERDDVEDSRRDRVVHVMERGQPIRPRSFA